MTHFNSKKGSCKANSWLSTLTYDEMAWKTYQEHRYQTRLSYILSCVAIIASIGMSLLANYLMLSGSATQANVTYMTGLISTGLYIPLSRDANRKIERLTKLTKDYRSLPPSSET